VTSHPLIRPRIYVAGPITGDTQANLARLTATAKALLDAGFAPYAVARAQGEHAAVSKGEADYAAWLEGDFSFIAACDAVLRIPEPSAGADAEEAWAKDLGIPVYYTVEDVIERVPFKGDARFHALLRTVGRLHDQKQSDYGREGDPFSNVRAAKEWGMSPWVGAFLRITDKVRRLQRFASRGSLTNESATDSMIDVAVYALIGVILLDEEGNGPR